jgi:hypothetical protein
VTKRSLTLSTLPLIVALALAILAGMGNIFGGTAAAATNGAATQSDPCDKEFRTEYGLSEAQIRIFEFAEATCVRVNLAENEVLVVGGAQLRVVNDTNQPAQEVINGSSTLAALTGPGVFVINDGAYGAARVVPAQRAQCEFERWAQAESGFVTKWPLMEWAATTAVCGALTPVDPTPQPTEWPTWTVTPSVTNIVAGGSIDFRFEADKPASSGVFTIQGQTINVTAPAVVTIANLTPANNVRWTLFQADNTTEAAYGFITVAPMPACTQLPAQNTWTEMADANGHRFVINTSGDQILRLCGQIHADVTIVYQGVMSDGKAKLGFVSGPAQLDLTIQHGVVFGVRSCFAFEKGNLLKDAAAAAGNTLDIIEIAPNTDCGTNPNPEPNTCPAGGCRIFLALVTAPAPVYNLPAPSTYNLSAPAGQPVASQSTGDGQTFEIQGSLSPEYTIVVWGTIENTPGTIHALRGTISVQLGGGAWAIMRRAEAEAFYNARKAEYGLTAYAPPQW